MAFCGFNTNALQMSCCTLNDYVQRGTSRQGDMIGATLTIVFPLEVDHSSY